MTAAPPFLDTNILVYAVTTDPKAALAERLLAAPWATSVQALNEFVNVARRKLGFGWAEAEAAVRSLRVLARAVHPVDLETHDAALALAARGGFAFFDALMVAAALKADAPLLLSEDMQDGRVIEGRLTIRNPFAG